jgi:hypothetical protein
MGVRGREGGKGWGGKEGRRKGLGREGGKEGRREGRGKEEDLDHAPAHSSLPVLHSTFNTIFPQDLIKELQKEKDDIIEKLTDFNLGKGAFFQHGEGGREDGEEGEGEDEGCFVFGQYIYICTHMYIMYIIHGRGGSG